MAPGKPGRLAFVVNKVGHIYNVAQTEIWLADGSTIRKVADGGYPSWMPDGRTLLWRSVQPMRLMRMDIDADKPRPEVFATLPPDASMYPFFTPDRHSVAYVAGDRIAIHNLQTGAVKKLPFPNGRTPKGFLGSWHPKGRYLGFGSYGTGEDYGLWQVDTETGESRQVLGGDATMPVWSPDGTRLALDIRNGSALRGVWLLDAPSWDDLAGPDHQTKTTALPLAITHSTRRSERIPAGMGQAHRRSGRNDQQHRHEAPAYPPRLIYHGKQPRRGG